jgi:hypothetical protein
MSAVSSAGKSGVALQAGSAGNSNPLTMADKPAKVSKFAKIPTELWEETIIPMIGNPGVVALVSREGYNVAKNSLRFVLEAIWGNEVILRRGLFRPYPVTSESEVMRALWHIFQCVKEGGRSLKSAQTALSKPQPDLHARLSGLMTSPNGNPVTSLLKEINAESNLIHVHDAVAAEIANVDKKISTLGAVVLENQTTIAEMDLILGGNAAPEIVVIYRNLKHKKACLQSIEQSYIYLFRACIVALDGASLLPYLSLIKPDVPPQADTATAAQGTQQAPPQADTATAAQGTQQAPPQAKSDMS